MSRDRLYNDYRPYDRPKLPRNKYGYVNESSFVGISNSASYGSSDGAAQIGVEMEMLDNFVGATRTEDGLRGVVPAPLAGQNEWFLQGSGGWVDIPAYRWFKEWPLSDGLEKTGLELDGDLNVTGTITTMNLEVQGAAHFWSLIIDEVKANGGQLLVSPSMFHVDYVGKIVQYSIFDASSPLFQVISNRQDIYQILQYNNVEYVRCRRLYQKCDDGERRIENECQIGDMMRCRSFNIKAGEYRNVSNTDYWSFVVNTGEEPFTDEDGNTFDAFFIDLAFTLRKKDGHNYPLGTVLYNDGTPPEYPKDYSEITDALELKKVSQEVWDGTRDVEAEYYENEEWTDIQEHVIKIRGLDDQINEITGRSSSNNLYDNNRYVSTAKESLDYALYGIQTSANPNGRSMSISSVTNAILTGDGSDSPKRDNDYTELDLATSESLVEDILGGFSQTAQSRRVPATFAEPTGLILNDATESIITLDQDTVIDKEVVVTEDVVVFDPDLGKDVVVYHEGEVLEPGTTITDVVEVYEREANDQVFKEIDDDIILITGNEKEQIDNTTDNTQSGMTRDPDQNFEEDQQITYWKFGYTGYYPDFRIKKGDSLACLGHLYDETRQNAIVLSSTNPIDPELLAPAMAQYSHINVFGVSISKFRQTAIAANGNEFIGTFLVNYKNTYLDVNERINLFINDLSTGLEAVGIHLDGEKSTITMKGSIDLRQHSQDSYDTLNLYDNLDVKRVEIKPFKVPERNSSESQINTNKLIFTTASNQKTAPSSYIKADSYKDWHTIITYSKYYTYTLENYVVNVTTSVNLGRLNYGYILDLRDLNLTLKLLTYLNGNLYTSDHGYDQQRITTVTYTLKKDGTPVSGKSSVAIQYSVGGINTENITLFANSLFNNYSIPSTGAYSLDVNIAVKVYAYYSSKKQYNNYYYTVKSTLSGDIVADVTMVQTGVAHPGDIYKMTIGTNGMQFLNDNSRYFYAATDGMEMRWDDSSISFDSTRGLYIRHGVRTITNTTALDCTSDVILCTNTGYSYTVTLPKTTDYGQGREITILGFANVNSALTMKTASGNTIEIAILGSTYSVTSLDFKLQEGYPILAVKMIAIGNTWRVISYN